MKLIELSVRRNLAGLGTALLLALPLAAQPAAPNAADAAAANAAQINAGRTQPKYPVPYPPSSVEDITAVLGRIYTYLDAVTPPRLIDRTSRQEITDYSKPAPNAMLDRSDFPLAGYEWGVTYSAMLLAGEATGDKRFTDYTAKRMKFMADVIPMFRAQLEAAPAAPATPPAPGAQGGAGGRGGPPFRNVIAPRSLDDSGSIAAAMLKTHQAGLGGDLRPLIDNYMKFISTGQFRFADGTFARNRPLNNSLWLDDLYMSVPALSQMGKLTGDKKYFDDAAKQILQFSERMFVKEKGLYLHGWIQNMDPHPAFHWGRANGWAILAMTELLSVLPENHPNRAAVLAQYRAHVRGIAATQGGDGFWHQLLDRSDSYPETSASAIFVFCIARGINRGWLDPLAHGPMASLGWNAVATMVNAKGQVEGTCVGTGMGFDPAFYYFRPVSPLAAHGYGPVLMAGAEMITLRKGLGKDALISDSAIQFARSPSAF
jgi:rhamnogalacturonyl hydrolase YesR